MIYRFASFEVDDAEFRLFQDGVPVVLEPKALQLLLFLVANPGRLIRKQEMLDAVWPDATVTENALTRSVALLRKTLGDDSREPRFIETAPRAGYRFLAEVTVLGARPALEPALPDAVPTPASPTTRPQGTEVRQPFLHLGAKLILGAGAIALAIYGGWHLFNAAGPEQPIRSIAVLPLENLSGDPSLEYFSDGTTAELITQVAKIPNLRVVSRTSAMREKGTHKPLAEIADELQVDAVVEGSVMLSAGRVRIDASLVRAHEERQLWSGSVEGSISDMSSLEDSVARQVTTHARLAAASPGAGAKSIHPAAHDAFLRGLYFYDKRDPVKSADYFRQAIGLDPAYSSAYAGLSEALVSEAIFGEAQPEDIIPAAKAAAAKAMEIDPENGLAYIARGGVETTLSWDWPAAARDLKRGLELSPGSSAGQMMFALYLDATNQPQNAVVHMRLARDADPLSFYMSRQYGTALFFARRYDDALLQLQQAKEMQGSAPNVVDNWISWIYEKKGMYDQAVEYNLRLKRGSYSDAELLALRTGYAGGGWKEFWREDAKGIHPDSAHPCRYFDLGLDYARIDDKASAFAALRQAADLRCFWMSDLQVNPLVDSLRDDARFQDLLRRVNDPFHGRLP